MKTCCPSCQTIFRVSSEQLRVRAGKVRCGQCRAVFNAIDNLVDEDTVVTPLSPLSVPAAEPATPEREAEERPAGQAETVKAVPLTGPEEAMVCHLPPPVAEPDPVAAGPAKNTPDQAQAGGSALPVAETNVDADQGQWLGAPPMSADRSVQRTFLVAAILLLLLLAAQLVFHLRSTLAISAPALRPALEALSNALGSEMPLPRRAELVSIESSDLQTDPGRSKLLVLQANLRNRASYAQAYPALELTLTDTRDKAVARRVLFPEEYLSPAALEAKSFAANAEVEIRLWLEAVQINAAGYRLYVFYP
ncbi:MAG: zinc-ribbon domain-containing protein [Candidatus Accumulibacter sp.]|uniref:DUF3426 domain-containing protein n=1 Tax=Accumulibacter sp. TaxID=2053492 RepID=UPI001A54E770|nr:DUF3426 domain-containing protein [Accumulibacter sp.]MBL8394170.1 zinc-ribbon domain-containing protein [Accumulibacter sp.]